MMRRQRFNVQSKACGAQYVAPDKLRSLYYCSLLPLHEGPHECRAGEHLIAVWPRKNLMSLPSQYQRWIDAFYVWIRQLRSIPHNERVRDRLDPDYLDLYKLAFRAGWRAAVNTAKAQVAAENEKKRAIAAGHIRP